MCESCVLVSFRPPPAVLLLDFVETVDSKLQNYDENAAWPVLLDEFVDYCRKAKKV